MPHHRSTRARLLPVVAVCLLVAGCASATAADPDPLTSAEVAAATSVQLGQADEAATDEGSDGTTGIHVTGAWEVVVRDPDGSVASETSFHNDLTPDGALTLARLLGDVDHNVYGLYVLVEPSEICSGNTSPTSGCYLGGLIPPPTRVVDEVANTVSVTVEREASHDGTFTTVRTLTSPTFNSQQRNSFTERVLDTPVTVVEGQTVEITVTISFS